MPKYVLHFSAGTLLFILLCVGILGGSLITGAVLLSTRVAVEVVTSPEELPNGELGPIGRAILEKKMSDSEISQMWGPVNTEKLMETKQGWLMDRMRARRAYRQSQPTLRNVRCTVAQRPYRVPAATPLPSPMPSNPMVPVNPVDVRPSVPRTPTPDISVKVPEWVVPSAKSEYCETGTCNQRN